MSTLIDSEASYKHRVLELLSEDDFNKLKSQGLATFAGLAFSVCEQPDKVSETKFESTCRTVFGPNAPISTLAAVRRLLFEGMTYCITELKHRMDSGDLPPRALPLQEREERRARQVQNLRGLLIEGELEPSHGLVDRAAQMLNEGAVLYIPPSICISRDDELTHQRKDKDFLTVEKEGVESASRSVSMRSSLTCTVSSNSTKPSPAVAWPSTVSGSCSLPPAIVS